MTFSIVARDALTGQLGGAVASKFLAVGGMVLHGRADVGVVATQALANVTYGPRGLDLLAAGAAPSQAIDVLTGSDPLPERRQVGIVDAIGRVAAHTGSGCMAWAGHMAGEGFSCQGNILASSSLLTAIADVMHGRADLPLADRLVAALAAGQAEGGDSRGQQSAAVLVVAREGGYGGADQLVDLRVDDHPTPLTELQRLLQVRQLLFGKPSERDLLPIEGELALEVATRLGRLDGSSGSVAGDADAVWHQLERWAGRENLEERMIRRGSIDVTVLDVLRAQTPT